MNRHEAKVRKLLESWALAVRNHDLDGVARFHAEDVTFFDVPPPTYLSGLKAYRDAWPPFFAYIGKTGQFDFEELIVEVGDEVAFAHGILRIRGAKEKKIGLVRLTVGLRKVDDVWTITHEHHSAPYE